MNKTELKLEIIQSILATDWQKIIDTGESVKFFHEFDSFVKSNRSAKLDKVRIDNNFPFGIACSFGTDWYQFALTKSEHKRILGLMS
jgi:hypothetical protein